MIWSDNDVANGFTTLKLENGEQAYHPQFIQCGMEVYREYQRRLWDSNCSSKIPIDVEVEEWHSHVYGNGKIGIFLFDLRGNRITPEGIQKSENSLLSDKQWQDFEVFMSNPELRAVILGSETPFIGEEPAETRKKVENISDLIFLKDHWYFNEEELLRLVKICFDWKAKGDGMHDLIFIAGGIHCGPCGVTSILTDEETGLQINHFTTSPVTNHVCDFFPALTGKLSDRFNFVNFPLGKSFRNYLDVEIMIDEDITHIQARLVPISTNVFKNRNTIDAKKKKTPKSPIDVLDPPIDTIVGIPVVEIPEVEISNGSKSQSVDKLILEGGNNRQNVQGLVKIFEHNFKLDNQPQIDNIVEDETEDVNCFDGLFSKFNKK